MTMDQMETIVDDVQEVSSEELPPSDVTQDAPSRWKRYGLLGVALLVAASGAFAWWQASHDADLKAADTRDVVLVQARQAIETMNTLDYRKVDAGVKAWAAVTTGTLRDQLAAVSAEDRTLLADQKKISTGRVVDAAVVDLDGNSATIIAAVEVTVKDAAKSDSEPTVKRNRFTADAVKVGGTWKLASLQQVAVSLS